MFDYFSLWEKRISHSKYQLSMFNKTYVYLMLNMLIIPAVTLTSQQTTIFHVLKEADYNIFTVLSRFYSSTQHIQA